jgi:acetyl-CoA synthetase
VAVDGARHLGRPRAFKETYWSRFAAQGWYFAGDGARYGSDGKIWVLGRIDDVMNVSGHRISTAEVESALVAILQITSL